HGPLAAIRPEHRDLIAWDGVTRATDHLHHTVAAAIRGRRWLAHARPTPDTTALAIGVLHLTHPATAAQLVTGGATGHAGLTTIHRLIDRLPCPTDLTGLSDQALKAACDRNGWLLGTAEEHTQRRIVERHISTGLDDTIRRRLADGDTTALAGALLAHAPTDADLDHAVGGLDPVDLDQQQRLQFLTAASGEALRRFAGLTLRPHTSRAEAIAGRFPERPLRHLLTVSAPQLVPDRSVEAPTASVIGSRPAPELAP
uniref:hypothetical protein n=1 Tax=Frankia sp. Cj3 TaxID=2880976 RepID=UPI001EF4A009